MSKLANKVAVVTGASKGIGASIAKAMAAEGASVVVNYAGSKDGAERTVAEITKAGGKAVAVQANVASAEDVSRLFNETVAAYGPADILVNNAGVYAFGAIEDFSEEEFHRQFDINVLGLLLATREAVKGFGDRGGSIINISSLASRITPPNTAIYSGTKGAVDAITATLAKELGPRQIRVNSINPGPVETEGVHSAGIIGSEMETQMVAQTPLGRIGQPKDIATVAVFLASDDAAWVTGESIISAGGFR